MRRRRVAAAWGTWLVVAGVLTATVCHALYYRSDLYRRRLQAELGEFFGLPVEVGGVAPHSFTARQLKDVRVWLPEKRDLIFRCPLIVWDTAVPTEGGNIAIEIRRPVWMLGSEAWGSRDYMRVLQAGLRHNFQAARVGEVHLQQARLEWLWPGCPLYAEDVEGKLVFDRQGKGRANLECRRFNGYATSIPIQISARVDPQADDLIPEVALVVPDLPVAALGLDQMLQSRLTQGVFAGTIKLHQSPQGDRIVFSGRAGRVRLEEWTKRVPGGAISGLLDLTIEEAVLQDRQLRELRFRGEAGQLAIDSLLDQFGWPRMGGTAHLHVLDAHVTNSTVARLHVSGRWDGGSLDNLCRELLGKTGLQGRLRARINALIVENNQIVSGDVELSGEPANGKPGTIDRALLLEAFERMFGLSLPKQLLPERVEYSQMGVRILISRQEIRVLSGQGPAGPAVITTRVFGQDLPLGAGLDLHLPTEEVLGKTRKHLDSLKSELENRLRASTRPFGRGQPKPATRPR